jgi:hypothetical protein
MMHLISREEDAFIMASIPKKPAKDAFKECPTPDPCLVVEGQRHSYAVSWRTENQIINSSYHKNSPDPVEGYVTGLLPTTLVDCYIVVVVAPARQPNNIAIVVKSASYYYYHLNGVK